MNRTNRSHIYSALSNWHDYGILSQTREIFLESGDEGIGSKHAVEFIKNLVMLESLNDDPIIVGQSILYETTAFSGFISESIDMNGFQIRPGVRFELFEQERVDRLNGSLYQDKTLFVLLPGIGFSKDISSLQIFGGIHRGFTPPSSGALKILSFGTNAESKGLDLDA